ncbi:MAG TPA: response regulator transcription factor [Ktedonobacteraceae bacterium]|nr:response regulator transcription factor [Ktedonobacteraceae bacterium]
MSSIDSSNETAKNAAPDIITIVLVDDHTMMREGTRRLLEEDPQLMVIGEAENGSEAVALCQQLKPRVVVLDIAMKGLNGFGVANALLAPDKSIPEKQAWTPGILVLTAYDQVAYTQAMLKMGVTGYWLKSARGSDIRAAVHDIAEGKRSIAPEVRQLLLEHAEDVLPRNVEPLTSREIAVVRLIVQGQRNSEIAQHLSISVKTVETHLTSIYSKLGVQSRAEAIAFAQRQGLLLE